MCSFNSSEPTLNIAVKSKVYFSLARLKHSFRSIVHNLYVLDDLHVFSPATLAEMRGLSKELQAEFNHHLIVALESVESRDWYRFGKARRAREKRLGANT